jgi:hypothetical protein
LNGFIEQYFIDTNDVFLYGVRAFLKHSGLKFELTRIGGVRGYHFAIVIHRLFL